jgi:hypothetical protein
MQVIEVLKTPEDSKNYFVSPLNVMIFDLWKRDRAKFDEYV